MRKIFIATGILFALVLGFANSGFAGHKLINGDKLIEMTKDGKPIVLVDVREPDLFAKSHIEGAINIPYDDAHARILKELDKKDRIVFICHGGPMGDELADVLIANGYRQVFNLAGGMHKWKGPVVEGSKK